KRLSQLATSLASVESGSRTWRSYFARRERRKSPTSTHLAYPTHPLSCRPSGLPASGPEGPPLHDGEHPVGRDFRPVLAVVRHDNAVVNFAVHEPFEDPQQMIRRHAKHRRAQTAELIE